MSDLFELTELAALVQTEVDDTTGTLLRTLVTGLIAGEIPSYDLDAEPVAPVVKAVALAAAARAYTNPQGLASETVGSYSYSRGSDNRNGGVYLTQDERALLRRVAFPNRPGLGTLTAVRGIGSTLYVEAITDGEPAPDPGSTASWPVPFE